MQSAARCAALFINLSVDCPQMRRSPEGQGPPWLRQREWRTDDGCRPLIAFSGTISMVSTLRTLPEGAKRHPVEDAWQCGNVTRFFVVTSCKTAACNQIVTLPTWRDSP